MASDITKVVCLAGGTGGYRLTKALSKNENLDLTVISPTTDGGGSTRRLLDEGLVSLPPGDPAQAIMAMSNAPQELLDLLPFRLQGSSALAKHSVVNILIAASQQQHDGDFKAALDTLCRICGVRGRVLPASERVQLGIERQDGSITIGEDEIDEQREDHLPPITKIFHQPTAHLDIDAAQAISEADAIIIGPGSFATSVASILVTNGMAEALTTTKAKIIGVANLANEAGHTSGWTAYDYGTQFNKLIAPAKLDLLIGSNGMPPKDVLESYRAQGEELVLIGQRPADCDYDLIEEDLLSRMAVVQQSNDAVKRSLLRHDTYMLSATIMRALRQLEVA